MEDRGFDLEAMPRDFDLLADKRWDSTVLLLLPGCPLYPACDPAPPPPLFIPTWGLFPGCRTYPALEAVPRSFNLIAE